MQLLWGHSVSQTHLVSCKVFTENSTPLALFHERLMFQNMVGLALILIAIITKKVFVGRSATGNVLKRSKRSVMVVVITDERRNVHCIICRAVHGKDEQFQVHRCPVFLGCVVTVSGLSSDERKEVKHLVEKEGSMVVICHNGWSRRVFIRSIDCILFNSLPHDKI